MAHLMALFSLQTNPRWRPPPSSWKNFKWPSTTGRPIHFMFGYRVGFSGTVDLMALFSTRTNSRWRPPPSWLISNGHILHNGSRSTYSAHRAVIFLVSQTTAVSQLIDLLLWLITARWWTLLVRLTQSHTSSPNHWFHWTVSWGNWDWCFFHS